MPEIAPLLQWQRRYFRHATRTATESEAADTSAYGDTDEEDDDGTTEMMGMTGLTRSASANLMILLRASLRRNCRPHTRCSVRTNMKQNCSRRRSYKTQQRSRPSPWPRQPRLHATDA